MPVWGRKREVQGSAAVHLLLQCNLHLQGYSRSHNHFAASEDSQENPQLGGQSQRLQVVLILGPARADTALSRLEHSCVAESSQTAFRLHRREASSVMYQRGPACT